MLHTFEVFAKCDVCWKYASPGLRNLITKIVLICSLRLFYNHMQSRHEKYMPSSKHSVQARTSGHAGACTRAWSQLPTGREHLERRVSKLDSARFESQEPASLIRWHRPGSISMEILRSNFYQWVTIAIRSLRELPRSRLLLSQSVFTINRASVQSCL